MTNTKPKLGILFLFIPLIIVSCKNPNEIELRISDETCIQIHDDQLIEYNLLKEIKGKVTIIDFWAPSCGPCIKYMQGLRDLLEKYPEDLMVVCVSNKRLEACKQFIKKDRFPFIFLNDTDQRLSNIFPHESIPYSIVIDRNGTIQEENISSDLTLKFVEDLILNNTSVTATNPTQIKDKSPLISFELLRHDNSEIGYSSEYKTINHTVRYGNDTITEIIRQSSLTGHNVMQLYQHAFDKLESKFEIIGDVPYITSAKLEDLFDLNFSCSNLYGDYYKSLIRELNSNFGLTTKVVDKEMTYYELVDIKVIPDTIEILTNLNSKQRGTNVVGQSCFIAKGNYSVKNITTLVERFFHENYKDKVNNYDYPVFTSIKGNYALNISVTDIFYNEATFISNFADLGLIFEKKHGPIEFVEIRKK